MTAPDQEEIARWLSARVARASGVEPAQIDRERAFTDYAFDSVVAVSIATELSGWLRRELPITVFWDCPSIAQLSAALGGGEAAP
ncbi:acyl carrier protein [Lysobacter enzymogenes]|uniref:acyl carrier protein n=1 Tax=Lysobacter enzymogenes TaxID=69 RepID=UPI001A96CC26|nr:acyl carrier protein [Lysobacter enzymogenes]QQP94977.1 acyl carrier protein [Lysobacter enzymogenes]